MLGWLVAIGLFVFCYYGIACGYSMYRMDVDGGSHTQLWMCGSEVLISPCSRVGHVYRAVSPYTFPEGTDKTVLTNQMRTMEVWLGAHKKFYYKSNPCASPTPLPLASQYCYMIIT